MTNVNGDVNLYNNRNYGLDVLRSIAVLGVLTSHSLLILHISSSVSFLGLLGVELFFILSGFLIGRILIKLLNECRNLPPKQKIIKLRYFWIRRWFRTLPMYYLMLIVNILIWIYYNGIENLQQLNFIWKNFIFLQNYDQIASFFIFPESWSLSVEEWFYIVVPIVLLVLSITKQKAYKHILLIIIITFVARWLYVDFYGAENIAYDYNIRRNIFLRMDSLAIGILIAYLYMESPTIFFKLATVKSFIAGLMGIVIVIAYMKRITVLPAEYWGNMYKIAFPCISVSFGLILCYMYNLKVKHKFGGVIWLSKISYSVYLIHYPIMSWVGTNTIEISLKYRLLICALVWMIVMLLSYLTYTYYEYPLMCMREKFAKKIE